MREGVRACVCICRFGRNPNAHTRAWGLRHQQNNQPTNQSNRQADPTNKQNKQTNKTTIKNKLLDKLKPTYEDTWNPMSTVVQRLPGPT